MPNLLLVRHGESTWNFEQRFTGWADVPLSHTGEMQMSLVGATLRNEGFLIDAAMSSELHRARASMEIILSALDLKLPPVKAIDWRLNERHYGALTGLSRAVAESEFGSEMVRQWRRCYDLRAPSLLGQHDQVTIWQDPSLRQATAGESLCDVAFRVKEFAHEILWPTIAAYPTTLVVGHGNSIRALISIIQSLPLSAVADLEIPNGQIYQFELNSSMNALDCTIFCDSGSAPSDIL